MNATIDLAARLYLANAWLPAAHEIDSAYWHEGDLFGLAGGIEQFSIVNLALLVVLLFGFERVVLWKAGAKASSYVLAGAGIFALSIHTILIAASRQQFGLPMSPALLTAILVVSVAQVLVVARTGRVC